MKNLSFTVTHEKLGNLSVHYYATNSAGEALTALRTLWREKVVGYDTETARAIGFEEDPKAGLDPWRSRPRLAQFATPDKRIFIFDLFTLPSEVKDALRAILEKPLPVKVSHNAKFDVKQSRVHLNVRHYGRVACTELMSRLIQCGLATWHIKLQNAVSQHLGIYLDKESQMSDWGAPELTEEQLRYAAIDAYVVLPLRDKLLEIVKELGLVRAAQIDFDTIDPVASMELNGFPLDREMWISTDEAMREKRYVIMEQINDLLRAEVIPQQALFSSAPLVTKKKGHKPLTSPKVIQEMLEALDIEVPEKRDRKTNKISKTTASPALEPIANSHEIIPLVLEFRELDKRKTSYGAKFPDEYVSPVTHRIHANFDPQKTKTARFACDGPNLQNIPAIKEYRLCFRPSAAPLFKDSVFVGADYSQIELRVAAEFSGDEGFINAFLSGEDFHTETAKLMFDPDGKMTKEELKEVRTYAKRINFGIIYGMGAQRLAAQTLISLIEAKGYLEKYTERFPRLMSYLYACGGEAATTGSIRTWTGRLVKFNVDYNDKGSIAQAKRNGMNTPIQGGAGEVLKIALRYLFDRIFDSGKDIRLVNIIHDEIILECEREIAAFAKTLLEKAMRDAGELILKRVPCVVDAQITEAWEK